MQTQLIKDSGETVIMPEVKAPAATKESKVFYLVADPARPEEIATNVSKPAKVVSFNSKVIQLNKDSSLREGGPFLWIWKLINRLYAGSFHIWKVITLLNL